MLMRIVKFAILYITAERDIIMLLLIVFYVTR